MKYSEYFNRDVLDRGYDYYISNRITEINLVKNRLKAKVDGSGYVPYDVEIKFNDTEDITSMYCSCPYAYDDNCKHMVAVLYKLEDMKKNTNKQSKFKEVLNNTDEFKLKKYLFDYFKYDNEFIDNYINEFKTVYTKSDEKEYMSVLDEIRKLDERIDYEEYRYDYDPYSKPVENPAKLLEDFIDNTVVSLYNKKEYDILINVLNKIYDLLDNFNNVDALYETEIEGDCLGFSMSIPQFLSEDKKEEHFNFLEKSVLKNPLTLRAQHYMTVFMECYTSSKYQKRICKLIDKVLKADYNYLPPIYAKSKYDIIKENDFSIEQQEQILEKYYKKDSWIKDTYIDFSIENKNYKKAIELLKEEPTDRERISNKLIELYELTNNIEGVKCELRYLIYESYYNPNRFENIFKLKEFSSSDEWIAEKDHIIDYYKQNQDYDTLNAFYIEEEDYEKLYENILENCSIKTLENHKKYYIDNHAEDIKKIYKDLIIESSKTARNNSRYNEILGYLRILNTYPDGENIVKNLVEELKNKYKTRKKFIELLNQL